MGRLERERDWEKVIPPHQIDSKKRIELIGRDSLLEAYGEWS